MAHQHNPAPKASLATPKVGGEVVSKQPYTNRAGRRHFKKSNGGNGIVPKAMRQPGLNEPYVK